MKAGLRFVSLLAVSASVACEAPMPPGFVSSLALAPDSAHIVPGEVVVFEAVPLAESGAPLLDRVPYVEWEVEGTDVVEFEPVGSAGRVTALDLGHATVRVELGRGEGEADVWVHPSGLASVEIDPSPVRMGPFGRETVRVVLRDSQGVSLDPGPFRISWKIDDADVAGLGSSPQGPQTTVFARPTPGRTRLTVIVNGRRASTSVFVEASSGSELRPRSSVPDIANPATLLR